VCGADAGVVRIGQSYGSCDPSRSSPKNKRQAFFCLLCTVSSMQDTENSTQHTEPKELTLPRNAGRDATLWRAGAPGGELLGGTSVVKFDRQKP